MMMPVSTVRPSTLRTVSDRVGSVAIQPVTVCVSDAPVQSGNGVPTPVQGMVKLGTWSPSCCRPLSVRRSR